MPTQTSGSEFESGAARRRVNRERVDRIIVEECAGAERLLKLSEQLWREREALRKGSPEWRVTNVVMEGVNAALNDMREEVTKYPLEENEYHPADR